MIEFFFLTLAVHRLTRFVTTDTIFDTARNRWWDRFPPESTKLGYLITCPWCLGFWFSLAVFICYTIVPLQTLWVCYVLALSTAVGLLTAFEQRI